MSLRVSSGAGPEVGDGVTVAQPTADRSVKTMVRTKGLSMVIEASLSA
jgi:hypothetical protein